MGHTFPETLVKVWCEILNDFEQILCISIPRCYFGEINEEIEQYSLHAFGDASKKAFCSVIYLVMKSASGYHCKLVTSKSRVVPLKEMSVPRLELIAALILARLLNNVKHSLESQILFESIYCWSDSTIVLSWLKNDRNYKQFVSNRTKNILKLTSPEMWNHCSTEDNPADIGTRGKSAAELKNSSLWWAGPEWLKGSPESYPLQLAPQELESDECLKEVCKKQITLQVSANKFNHIHVNLDEVISADRYSSCNHLFRVTALVLRFIHNLKAKIRGNNDNILSDELTTAEIEDAECLWIKAVKAHLKEDKKFPQLKNQLGLFEDPQGIIRCRGRIGNSGLRFETKFPALLVGHHPLTMLIIKQAHDRVLHNGLKSTLNEFRAKFWLTRARQRIRNVIHKCNTCRRFESLPYQYPVPPHLPDFRVEGTEAFSSVGTDLAGPLYIRHSLKDTNTHKVWIVIFTCTLSRAVHLEIMQDMSAEQFILALRRFISRRGTPSLIVSDNAKTFKRAEKSLQDLFKNKEVKQFLTLKRIRWQNILSKAPWHGGIYERLIKSVKRCLKKVLRSSKVTLDELHTLVVEVEGTLNNRPLTYLSAEEFDKALTPSHLICGRRLEQLPDLKVPDGSEELNPNVLNKRQKYLSSLLRHWWDRWKHEYLVNLRESHNLSSTKRGEPQIKQGDVVTVHQDKVPRGFWHLGKIEHLIESKDGKVRGATLKVVSPGGKMSLINRPLSKLFPVEIVNREAPDATDLPSRSGKNEEQQNRRPKRAAALDADTLRRLRDVL